MPWNDVAVDAMIVGEVPPPPACKFPWDPVWVDLPLCEPPSHVSCGMRMHSVAQRVAHVVFVALMAFACCTSTVLILRRWGVCSRSSEDAAANEDDLDDDDDEDVALAHPASPSSEATKEGYVPLESESKPGHI